MLGSQINFGVVKDRHSIPVLILSRHSTSSNVMLQSCHAFLAFILNRVCRKACIRSVTACRHRALATAWKTVLSLALPSFCMLDFKFANDYVNRFAVVHVHVQRGIPANPVQRLVDLAFGSRFTVTRSFPCQA